MCQCIDNNRTSKETERTGERITGNTLTTMYLESRQSLVPYKSFTELHTVYLQAINLVVINFYYFCRRTALFRTVASSGADSIGHVLPHFEIRSGAIGNIKDICFLHTADYCTCHVNDS